MMGSGRSRARSNPVHMVATWVRRQPPKVQAFLAVVAGMASLVFLRMVVHDHENLFVAAEAAHAIGICVLIYKLIKERTCAGLFSLALRALLLFFFVFKSINYCMICWKFWYSSPNFFFLSSYFIIWWENFGRDLIVLDVFLGLSMHLGSWVV